MMQREWMKAGARMRRFAPLLAAGALAAGMAGTAICAPAAAIAEDGTVTITQTANGEAAYRAYQVFAADVYAQGSDSVATHVTWASDAVRDVVVAFLEQADARTGARVHADYTGGADPQQAAEYIGARIAEGAVDAAAGTEPPTPAADSFAMDLGRVLAASALGYRVAASGEPFTGPEGYWLFVTDGGSIGAGEAGSAPIWVPIGGAATSVLAKEAAPTVFKEVREDSTGQWGPAADASTGEDLDYRITATMPANLGSLRSYHLKLADTLPEGMALADGGTSSVKVSAGGVDVTEQAHVDWSGGVLSVDIADAKSLSGVAVTRETNVTVEYRAHLDGARAIGAEGNRNGVVMTYTSDPVSLGEGSAVPPATQTYSYAVELDKRDKATGDALPGARFTMQAADTQDGPEGSGIAGFADSNAGRYVQADGSLGDAPHEFETGDGGTFSVEGLDAGSYVIREVAAPEGYELQDADIRLVLSSSFDGRELAGLSASVSGGEQSRASDGDIVTHVAGVDSLSGKAQLQTSDDKKVSLPLTGLEGTTAIYASGGVLVLLALAGLLALRRRDAGPRAGR